MTEARPPREEGFSKDADKLIRRLSLVAFLLARPGHPATAEEIRHRVEGYALMTDEAFKRRFYEDRAELAGLGIEVAHDEDDEGDLYSLPAAAYYLPAIRFTPDELSALATCLFVLEGFAFGEPLRLALLSLAHGRPELRAGEAAAPMSVLPEQDARRAAASLPKLQQAIAARKTVRFAYYAIGSDTETERVVDPYSLMVVGDEWYLIGHCHLRGAIRTFRLSRLRSGVRHETKAPHDFEPPDSFTVDTYVNRPAWQLGGIAGEAAIAVGERMAWWIEAHYAHCGTIEAGRDGGIVYRTGYASAQALVSWVLSMGDDAEILEPQSLRQALAAQLRLLRQRLDDPPAGDDEAGAPEARPVKAARPAARPADWAVEVDRFTRLTALLTYLYGACKAAGAGDEVPLGVADVCRALDLTPADLKADVRLLNLVNFGGEGTLVYAEVKGDRLVVTCDVASSAFARPARLSPLQADTLLLAVELLGGQVPTEHGAALRGAAQKLREARSAAPPSLAAADLLPPQEQVLDAVNTAIAGRRPLEIVYFSAGTGVTSRRTVEPYLLVRTRGEWYYVAWCRASEGVRVFRVATTKEARVTAETFAPRPDTEIELYRREGVKTSAQYAPRRARVWFSVEVARWVAERRPVTPAAAGAVVAELPYVDAHWLVRELLQYGGQAVPLAPPEAIAALAGAADGLLARYT